MGRKRYIDTSFWDDTWIQELDPSEKFLYIYLLTNPLTNVAGISELTVKRICFDTGFNADTVKNILHKYEVADKVYTWGDYIILKNAPKHQLIVKDNEDDTNNKPDESYKPKTKENNIYKGIVAILNQLPDELLLYLYFIGYTFEDLTEILDEKNISYEEVKTLKELKEETSNKGLQGASRNSNYINLNINSDSDLNSDSNSNLYKPPKIQKKHFIPPTLEEIRAYCSERNNNIDAEYFRDYYETRNWELKKNQKVSDWKACVRTWEKNQKNNRFSQNNYQKNNKDYSQMKRLQESV